MLAIKKFASFDFVIGVSTEIRSSLRRFALFFRRKSKKVSVKEFHYNSSWQKFGKINCRPNQRSSNSPVFSPRVSYDLAANCYDKWKWQKLWLKFENPILSDICNEIGEVDNFLDFGIGTGLTTSRLTNRLRAKNKYGIDPSRNMLNICKKRLGNEFTLILGDSNSVSEIPVHLDLVLMTRVSSHIWNLSDCIRSISDSISPNGYFILSELDNGHSYECTRLPTDFGKIAVETYKRSQSEIIDLFSKHGLNSVKEIQINSEDCVEGLTSEVPSSVRLRGNGGLLNVTLFKKIHGN